MSAFRYLYDSVHRRTQALLEDGSSWNYGYNGRNELTSAKRKWEDFAPVSGQQFQFAFDNMGNRTNAASGGDANGANLRVTQYSANALNQYTSVTTPGFEDILGAAIATTNVTVDGGACDRKGEYFHREIAVTNTSAPVWRGVTVSCGGSSSNGGFVFPKNSQSLSYDLDGNLTADGIWTYVWDAENRLKEMSMGAVSGITNAQRKKLQFTYDAQGRRVQKVVSIWNGSAFASPVTNKFVYDGWNLLAVLTSDLGLLTSFTWGQDLSGTMDKAGGVGGLLAVTDHQAGVAHFAGFDGNGNITALVKTDGSVSARYEYSPFGEPLRMTGPAASVNPFRWSTKFADEESGLVYYGYRFYSPVMGRWINRDPFEERGGRNLYGFVVNCPLNGFDIDGREYTLGGAMLTMGIGGIFGGLYNATTGESFAEGFAIGAAGAGTAYVGAFALGSVVIGSALGGAADCAGQLTVDGKWGQISGGQAAGRIALSMIAGGIMGRAGEMASRSLAGAFSGLPNSQRERFAEIGLDATLALAGEFGVGLANIGFDLFDSAEGAVNRLGSGYSNELENASQ